MSKLAKNIFSNARVQLVLACAVFLTSTALSQGVTASSPTPTPTSCPTGSQFRDGEVCHGKVFRVGGAQYFTTHLNIPLPPTSDARCLGSPAHLGTDNLPFWSETKNTSIINMWAFATRSHEPIGWLYRTQAKVMWFQARLASRQTLHDVLTGDQYLRLGITGNPDSMGGIPVVVDQAQVAVLKTALATKGIALYPCFTSRFPASKL